MIFSKWIALLTLVFGVCSVPANAARPARVDVDEAAIYQTLTPGARTVRSVTRGTRLVVSNNPTQGFYKVRTNEGETGWVSEKALQLLERPSPEDVKQWEKKEKEFKENEEEREAAALDAAREEEERKNKNGVDFNYTFNNEVKTEGRHKVPAGPRNWSVAAFYGTATFELGQLRSLTALDIPRDGHQLGIEVSYLPRKSWVPLLFRLESVGSSSVYKDPVSGQVYRFDMSSTPIMVGTRFDLTDRKDWALDLAILVGMSVNQQFSSTALSQSGNNQVSMNASAFTAIIKTDLAYSFVENWYAFLELGYRSLRSGNATYSGDAAAASGSSIFFRDGALKSVTIDYSGFFASFGVSYAF